MYVDFQGSIPKDDCYPDENEDVLRGNGRLLRVALSDGASESFDSKTWAGILAARLLIDPNVTPAWVEDAMAQYRECHQPEKLSWSKLAAFERGSFATLLGVSFDPSLNRVSLVGIGDSIAALTEKGNFLKSFPYQRAVDFERRPQILSTNPSLNAFVRAEDFRDSHTAEWDLSGLDDPVLLCMTDALGQWLLTDVERGGTHWVQMLTVNSVEQFDAVVRSARQARAIRSDDTTLAVIRFGTP